MSVVQFMRLDNILKLLNEGAINQTFCKMIDRLRKFRRKYAEGDHSGLKFIANVVRCVGNKYRGRGRSKSDHVELQQEISSVP